MRMIGIAVVVLSLASSVLAGERTVTVMADKTPALVLTAPAAAEVTPWKGKTVIHTTNMFLNVWLVPEAKTLNDVQARLDDVIKGDVLKFVASATNQLTVAGSPALHLSGKCVEADDGDAATADIVIFSVGNHIFVAYVHGEDNAASRERDPMLKMLQTAKSPQAQPAAK